MKQIIQNYSKNNLVMIESIISFSLFIFTLLHTDILKEHLSFSIMIGLILYYMIFLELVRALIDFTFEKEHKFKVRYIYDMGIIFLIRELLVSITSNHHHIEEELMFLTISTVLLIVLFVLRIYDAKTFKYLENCDNCKHNFEV